MRRLSLVSLVILALLATSCTGSNSTPTTGPGGSTGGTGSVKVLHANINNVSTLFTATIISGAFSGGNLVISGTDGSRTLTINAISIPGASTFTLNPGNIWNAIGQVIDGSVGTLSTGFTPGTGTVTLTTASLSRITGTFSFTAYSSLGATSGAPVATVFNGVFDISNP